MREIKFRAWDSALKEILPNVQNHIGNGEWAFGNMLNDDRYSVMQYTGLTDKNRKEIYEGDIVKVLMTDWASKSDSDPRTIEEYLDDKSELYVIAFHRTEFSMLFKGDEDYPHYMRWGTHGFIKVIGNIYENPEALEE